MKTFKLTTELEKEEINFLFGLCYGFNWQKKIDSIPRRAMAKLAEDLYKLMCFYSTGQERIELLNGLDDLLEKQMVVMQDLDLKKTYSEMFRRIDELYPEKFD